MEGIGTVGHRYRQTGTRRAGRCSRGVQGCWQPRADRARCCHILRWVRAHDSRGERVCGKKRHLFIGRQKYGFDLPAVGPARTDALIRNKTLKVGKFKSGEDQLGGRIPYTTPLSGILICSCLGLEPDWGKSRTESMEGCGLSHISSSATSI